MKGVDIIEPENQNVCRQVSVEFEKLTDGYLKTQKEISENFGHEN